MCCGLGKPQTHWAQRRELKAALRSPLRRRAPNGHIRPGRLHAGGHQGPGKQGMPDGCQPASGAVKMFRN